MDVYSNILFVKEQAATLSALAQSTASTDKYRQETCCVIGNFFSHKVGDFSLALCEKNLTKVWRHVYVRVYVRVCCQVCCEVVQVGAYASGCLLQAAATWRVC